jgi:hypothetical protein
VVACLEGLGGRLRPWGHPLDLAMPLSQANAPSALPVLGMLVLQCCMAGVLGAACSSGGILWQC